MLTLDLESESSLPPPSLQLVSDDGRKWGEGGGGGGASGRDGALSYTNVDGCLERNPRDQMGLGPGPFSPESPTYLGPHFFWLIASMKPSSPATSISPLAAVVHSPAMLGGSVHRRRQAACSEPK